MFVKIKVALNLVDREKMQRAIKETRVRKELVKRCENVLQNKYKKG